MGKVLAVCISERKGTQKRNVGSAVFVEDWGLEGDAHAGADPDWEGVPQWLCHFPEDG